MTDEDELPLSRARVGDDEEVFAELVSLFVEREGGARRVDLVAPEGAARP
ncbi:MAG: hypothetical protein LC785_11930 [Acidobacteria bacterium]|nr:hypothetical protein [Acidobacteriota bacterium]